MNPLFLWNNKLSLPRGSIKNWISPDDSNDYYIDSNPTGASATISSKNGEFTSFTRSDADTIYIDWDNGNDTTGNGTWANPYKSLYKAMTLISLTFFQIGLKTISQNHDILAVAGRVFNFPSGLLLVRIFAVGNRAPIISNNNATTFFSTNNISNFPSDTHIEFYNLYFNCGTSTGTYLFQSLMLLYHNYFDFYFCQYWKMEGISGINYNYISSYLFQLNELYDDSEARYQFFNCFIDHCQTAGWITQFQRCRDNLKNNIFNYGKVSAIGGATPIIENKNIFNLMDIYHYADPTASQNIYFNCNFFGAIPSQNYSCNNNLLHSGTGNIKANQLFINTDPLIPEDFQLQIQGLGYVINSPCFRTGNALQNEDIGAWQFAEDFSLDEYVPTEAYKKYLLEHSPKQLFMSTEEIQMQVDYGLTGRPFPSKLNSKKRLEFVWEENSQMSENDRAKLNRISQKKFDNIQYRTQKNIDILYFDDFENGIDSGSILAFDLLNDTIQIDKNISTEWIGFQIWLILNSVSGTIAGQIISGFSGLTVDSLIGYWVADYNSKMIYQIISNTATTITVHDPYEYLTDGTAIVKIIKSIKIFDIEDDIIYLNEAPGALDTAAASWIIQEIILRTPQQNTRYSSEIGYRKLATPYGIRTGITYAFIEK